MPSPSLQLMTELSPELGAKPVAATFLKLAAAELDPESWGGLYLQGSVYLALHRMTLHERALAGGVDAPTGAVTSRRAGALAVGYGGGAGGSGRPGESDYHSTPWGQTFLAIQARVPHVPLVGRRR